MKEKIRSLINQLNYYTKLYDSGQPVISDAEYDKLYYELVALEKETGLYYPDSPTQMISFEVKDSLLKVPLTDRPMLSLDKTKDWGEIAKFAEEHKTIITPKLDGLSCRLIYEDGRLSMACTRGNGQIGEDITSNAKVVKNIPQYISAFGRVVIDGEMICKIEDFAAVSDEYSNPRNYAAGSIRLLSNKESMSRNLSFIAWDLITNPFGSYTEGLEYVSKLGFEVAPHWAFNALFKPEEKREELVKTFPIDGLVARYNDTNYALSLGATNHHPKYSISFKFYDDIVPTRLTNIEWQVGRTGKITPVAIFEPIEISSTIVERASLHNLSILSTLTNGEEPRVGSIIGISKANDIIPYCSEWENGEGEILPIPSACPICGQPTGKVADGISEFLYCSNPACSGKIVNILAHYCSRNCMNIKGLSEQTFDKLLDWGWINSIQDIYTLTEHRKDWIKKDGFGPKSVDNILAAIERSKKTTLSAFITAIGIPLIGGANAKILEKTFGTWAKFYNAATGDYNFTTIEGFGPEMAVAIKKFNYAEADYIATTYLTFEEVAEEGNTLKGMTFVITGDVAMFKNRNELKDVLVANGAKVSGSVSKNTSFLINNDVNSTTSKNQTAKKLGVEIISEKNLLEKFDFLKKI